ncbi:hypothetical protein D3C73_1372310 [compost metagenome]
MQELKDSTAELSMSFACVRLTMRLQDSVSNERWLTVRTIHLKFSVQSARYFTAIGTVFRCEKLGSHSDHLRTKKLHN